MHTLELVQPFLPHLNIEIFWVFLLGGKIKKNLKIQIRQKMVVLILGYALELITLNMNLTQNNLSYILYSIDVHMFVSLGVLYLKKQSIRTR